MQVLSTRPAVRGRVQPSKVGRRALLIIAAVALLPAASFACKGGIPGKSPENPSAILAVIGGAAMGWKALLSRIRR